MEELDRDVHRDPGGIGYWDLVEESHVCQAFLTIPYSLPKISSNKNPYTDNKDAEVEPEKHLMQVLSRWDVVLCLGDRAPEAVGWYIDVGDW